MLSQEAGAIVKEQGGENDMLTRIKKSPFFTPIHGTVDMLFDPSLYIGRAPQQVNMLTELIML